MSSTPSETAPPNIPQGLDESWRAALGEEFGAPYMAALKAFLVERKAAGARIFPRGADWFNALAFTPLDSVRAVILGQDPYHGPGQAHGLCFSVPPGVPPPPSLVNIFKELKSDLGIERPGHGYLEHWARQGVLLLNSVLTVEMGQAGAHANRGWERFNRCRHCPRQCAGDAGRFPALGQLCAEEGGLCGPRSPPRAEGAASLSALRA